MILKTRYLFPALQTFGIKSTLNLDQKNSKFTASQLFKELNEIRNWLKHTMLHSNCIEQHYVEQSTLNSRPFHWADTVILGISNTVSESQKCNLLKLLLSMIVYYSAEISVFSTVAVQNVFDIKEVRSPVQHLK